MSIGNTMGRSILSRVIFGTLILAIVMVGNAFLFQGRLSRWTADITVPLIASVTVRFSGIHAFLTTLLSRDDLVRENLRLTAEIERLQSNIAHLDELRREVELYRLASGLQIRRSDQTVAGAVFSYPRTGGTRAVILNKGKRHGIDAGDVVITPGGALIGVVRTSFDDHAVVLVVGDPLLEVTGRIMNTDISGLVRFT